MVRTGAVVAAIVHVGAIVDMVHTVRDARLAAILPDRGLEVLGALGTRHSRLVPIVADHPLQVADLISELLLSGLRVVVSRILIAALRVLRRLAVVCQISESIVALRVSLLAGHQRHHLCLRGIRDRHHRRGLAIGHQGWHVRRAFLKGNSAALKRNRIRVCKQQLMLKKIEFVLHFQRGDLLVLLEELHLLLVALVLSALGRLL